MKKKHSWVRILLDFMITGTTLSGCYILYRQLWTNGGSFGDVLLLLVFTLLYLWISISFWIATLGLVLCIFDEKQTWFNTNSVNPGEYDNLPHTAVIMPIYNEDPSRVFSGLLATYESIQKTGHSVTMDFFALSDTNDPEKWIAEELVWADLRRNLKGPFGFYYRHRQKNIGRKSGNIRDFCERWGGAYKYMIILDADSVMDGWTILEMIRRMEQNEHVGIFQVPPVPVSRQTLFARIQQFGAYIYGRIYVRGYASWSQGESNYWGHNAIIRVEPFTKHCGLPRLPGQGPLGGEILSHDFVEAALMLRKGWEVRIASDLGGSYEEPPTTIIDFVERSRRWCQGNLQHLRLIALHGFHAISRIYFGMGAMSYLSSLLWLVFILLTLVNGVGVPSHSIIGLWMLSMMLLFLPKIWGYLVFLHDNQAAKKENSKTGRVLLSVFLESVISILTAPIFMMFNVRFVITLLLGRGIRWDTQRRDDTTVKFSEAAHKYSLHTLVGAIGLLLLISTGSIIHIWLLIVLMGLLLSVPLEMSLSSMRIGLTMRNAGLFLYPEETEPPNVLVRQRILRDEIQQTVDFRSREDIFRRIVLDPGLNGFHIALLKVQGIEKTPWEKIESIANVALHGGPEHLTLKERLALLSNSEAIAWLHRQAWKKWKINVDSINNLQKFTSEQPKE